MSRFEVNFFAPYASVKFPATRALVSDFQTVFWFEFVNKLCSTPNIYPISIFSAGSTHKASQIYDKEGNIVTKIYDIEPDTDLFLSYGEPFSKPKIHNFLDISFYGVTAHKFPHSDSCIVVKRPLEDDETSDPPKMFAISEGLPTSYKQSDLLVGQKQKQLRFSINEMAPRQIFEDHSFFQFKSNPQRLLYATLLTNQRTQAAGKVNLLSYSQTWIYTKNHELKPKAFPKLSLGVSNHSVFIKVGDDLIEGYMVTFQVNGEHSWECTKEGQIACSRTGLYLTCLDQPAEIFVPNVIRTQSTGYIRQTIQQTEKSEGGVFDMFGKSVEEEVCIPDVPAGEEPFIVALPALKKLDSQRWAFKQENIALLGQWKLCDIENPEWAKECLSWPTNSDGSENSKLSWPVEGLLLSKAPPLQETKSPKKQTPAHVVLRLSVRNNGSCDSARHITAPDLSNMKKDLAIKRRSLEIKRDRQPDTQRWLDKHSKGMVHDDQEKVSELEFRLFLDKCGSVLGLTTPPTRLFLANGEEIVSLESLERDTEVYVSCGPDFIPPDGEKNARNKYLHDVAHDVNKMKTFCSAISPTTYVVSVSAVKRHEVARLQILTDSETTLLNDSDSMSDILQIAEVNKSIEDNHKEPSEISIDSQACHFKSHVCQNESDLGMIEQFPWRNPAFTSGLVKDKLDWQRAHSSGESEVESDCESIKSIRSNSSVSSVKSKSRHRVFNQWIYKDCRFFLLENPQYVLSAGVGNEVELMLYDKNSADQCWTVDEDFIYSSNGQTLTVSQCSVNPPNPVDHAGSKLRIAPYHAVTNGNTNQKWQYDTNTGHLIALAGTPLCRSLSAALQAKICTYAVTSSENAEQPTYIMENPGISGIPDDNTHIYVCGSCATALRDRYSVDKIESTTFVCSVGYYCSTANLDMRSSLVALGGLDGLMPGKAFGTLYLWESLLGDLRQQTSLKSIKDVVRQTLQLECPNEGLVLVRCYLNGTGPPRHRGTLFLARSFEEILRKCLIELKAGRPLSRIFLPDGSEIPNFQSLFETSGTSSESQSQNSLTNEGNVPYKELFVSAGEDYIKPKKPRGVPSLKRRLKMYRQLSKLDVMSLQSVSTSRDRVSRPPHLPAGYTKHALPVYITRNGDFSSSAVRVVAHNLDVLLETATSRLNMPLAARRVYSSSGVEVVSWGEVVRDQALVVSAGEPFARKGQARKSKWLHRKVENEK